MPLNHNTKYNELPDHQYALIGKIIVEFSNVDTLLAILLTRLLLSPDFLGRSYTDQISHNGTVAAIKNALDVHKKRYSSRLISEEKAAEIKALLIRIKTIQDLRNKFAHSNLSRHLGETVFGTKFSGKPPNDEGETTDYFIMNDAELKDLYDRSYQIVDVLQLITETIKEVDETVLLKELLKPDVIR